MNKMSGGGAEMALGMSDRIKPIHARVAEMIRDEITPASEEFHAETVRKLDAETFEVVVREASTTTHRVTLSPAYHARLTEGRVSPEQLIEKSFEFLLEREGNTSILRAFDLAERVLPPEQLASETSEAESRRELVRRASRSHGVGTAGDLADYYRMPVRLVRDALTELVGAGELLEVRVEGWTEAAYRHPDARLRRRIDAAALLSPFYPVVWHRPRTARGSVAAGAAPRRASRIPRPGRAEAS